MTEQKSTFVIDTALLSEIFQAVVAIGQAVVQYGPSVITGIENVYDDLKLAWESVTAGDPLTPVQLAAIRANLDRANQAVANAAAAAEAEDAQDTPPAPEPEPAPEPTPDPAPTPDPVIDPPNLPDDDGA